jgi:bile acid:Na+ symporter, BASS family
LQQPVLSQLDEVKLAFSPDSLILLNICLGLIMLGVAINLKVDDFQAVASQPRLIITGLVSQFILLPLFTLLLTLVLQPVPSVALGMILVAACPGGNISNFISVIADGNIALSVSLTAFSTVFSVFLTPIGFSFWSQLNPDTANLLREISVSYWDISKTVFFLLGIPIVMGMMIRHHYPVFADRVQVIFRYLSILIFAGFVIVSFAKNVDVFLEYFYLIVLIVLAHNSVAISAGYLASRFSKLDYKSTKTIMIETGIQNSGLALILIFDFFEGLGGMAIVAGWWGIWHILSGLALAYVLKNRVGALSS